MAIVSFARALQDLAQQDPSRVAIVCDGASVTRGDPGAGRDASRARLVRPRSRPRGHRRDRAAQRRALRRVRDRGLEAGRRPDAPVGPTARARAARDRRPRLARAGRGRPGGALSRAPLPLRRPPASGAHERRPGAGAPGSDLAPRPRDRVRRQLRSPQGDRRRHPRTLRHRGRALRHGARCVRADRRPPLPHRPLPQHTGVPAPGRPRRADGPLRSGGGAAADRHAGRAVVEPGADDVAPDLAAAGGREGPLRPVVPPSRGDERCALCRLADARLDRLDRPRSHARVLRRHRAASAGRRSPAGSGSSDPAPSGSRPADAR